MRGYYIIFVPVVTIPLLGMLLFYGMVVTEGELVEPIRWLTIGSGIAIPVSFVAALVCKAIGEDEAARTGFWVSGIALAVFLLSWGIIVLISCLLIAFVLSMLALALGGG